MPRRFLPSRCAGSCKARTWRRAASLLLFAVLLDVVIDGCGGPAPRPRPPSEEEPVRPRGEAKKPPAEPSRAQPAAELDSTAHPGNLTVDITEAEKSTLVAQAQSDLEASQGVIDSIDPMHLSEDAVRKVQTIVSLMAAAREAGAKDDVPGMANLARKARLLARELALE